MNEAPIEFKEHIDLITDLADRAEPDGLQIALLDAIESLVRGMNGPWHGCGVAWIWGEVPDSLAELLGEGGAWSDV